MDITSLATVLVLVLLLNIVSSLYTDTPTPDVNPFPEIWNNIFCEFLEDANNPINAIWKLYLFQMVTILYLCL